MKCRHQRHQILPTTSNPAHHCCDHPRIHPRSRRIRFTSRRAPIISASVYNSVLVLDRCELMYLSDGVSMLPSGTLVLVDPQQEEETFALRSCLLPLFQSLAAARTFTTSSGANEELVSSHWGPSNTWFFCSRADSLIPSSSFVCCLADVRNTITSAAGSNEGAYPRKYLPAFDPFPAKQCHSYQARATTMATASSMSFDKLDARPSATHNSDHKATHTRTTRHPPNDAGAWVEHSNGKCTMHEGWGYRDGTQ